MKKSAKNLPPDVERYVEEGKDQGMPEDKAWAVAWSRWCKYKSPGDKHCTMGKGDYLKGKKTASSGAVAYRHLIAAGARLDPKVKRSINRDLIRLGMDGNKRFDNISGVLNYIGVVLTGHGVEWGEVLDSHRLSQNDGRMNINLAMSNPDNPFAPTDITNTSLTIHWATLGTGIEAIAYIG